MKMQAFWVKGDKSKAVPFLSRPEKLDGTLAGDVGFDPLGISNYWDIKWMREAELKHGRICMLATAGILVQEFVHLPGAAFSKKVALEAWSSAPRGGMIQILVAIGLIELVSNRYVFSDGKTRRCVVLMRILTFEWLQIRLDRHRHVC